MKETSYRVYMTDAISALVKMKGGNISKRWYDVVNPPKVDDRTGDEIALDVIARLTGEEVRVEST